MRDASRQTSALRLYGLLRSAIRHGHIAQLEHLVEDRLIIDYKMSRNAVRRALSLLAEDGLVSRGPRHGTVVVGSIASLVLDDPRGEDPEHVNSYTIVVVEQGEVPTNPLLAEKLATTSDTLHMVERICYRFGQPYCVHTTYWQVGGDAIRPSITDFPGRGFDKL
ncbi:MAG: GntR family transcriptional regulator, partial [Subtercola sp.]|nr:GntR family transcriptional regulator [Subtercola sp.]